MLSNTVYLLMVVMPLLWSLLHILILNSKSKIIVVVNYFIGVNIFFSMLINAAGCLVFTSDIAHLQGWEISPAMYQMGILYLSLSLTGLAAIFMKIQFKLCTLITNGLYTLMSIISMIIATQSTVILLTPILLNSLLLLIFILLSYICIKSDA